MMRRVLITGINGFIGSHLCQHPALDDWQIRTLARDRPGNTSLSLTHVDSTDSWAAALEGIDAIVHLAGIAHRRASPDDHQSVNCDWPVRLYEAASAAGVHSFIQLSSIKVLGDSSVRPLQTGDPYQSSDPYSVSKMMAERQLLAIDSNTSLAIIRSPLVYGPGVKANFRNLLKLAELGRRGLPLPLGRAQAPRSMVSTNNLCNLITTLLNDRPESGSEPGILHVCDERDWNVSQLLRLWGVKTSRLWRIPIPLARSTSIITGQRNAFDRLFGPLQIDQSATLATVPWQPDGQSREHLSETFAWYLSNR